MANWRQIQGRIRRARTSADPAGKLNELFQKTRDAMVAFEAGALEEKSGRSDEAVRWYTIAAQRFRRTDWRQKAAEALTRLGAPVPEEMSPAARASQASGEDGENAAGVAADTTPFNVESADAGEAAPGEIVSEAQGAGAPKAVSTVRPAGERTGRRRGRRGGRRHRRGGARDVPTKAGAGHAHTATHHQQHHAQPSGVGSEEETMSTESVPAAEGIASAAARFVPEPTGPFVERTTYIRAGDPALASRFAQLESLLRRLISAPLHRMDEVEDAPAGPGVFLLSDSDLMTNYYIEACKTLRIGASQLARAGRAGRGARTEGKTSLRSQMAEHLEINDTQVTDYLRKHCVVRWLQLDEDASHVAHFAIALLRPALNVE
ncbi:MAG: hypothetical protein WA876_12810 [Candidatus Acidiferrales bacterium]